MAAKETREDRAMELAKCLKEVAVRLTVLQAVQLLEAHNKNWLAFDDNRRTEEKISLIKDTIIRIQGTLEAA